MLRTQAWQQCNAFLGDQTSKFTFCISITCFVFVEHNIFIRFIERISPCFAQLFAAASKLNAFFGCVFIENTLKHQYANRFRRGIVQERRWKENFYQILETKPQETQVSIELVTVFDAILTSTQMREKLQCLYENLMSNNFRRTDVLKKVSTVN